MLYQLSYASATQTKRDYQKGTPIASARLTASNSSAPTNYFGDLIVQHNRTKATEDLKELDFALNRGVVGWEFASAALQSVPPNV